MLRSFVRGRVGSYRVLFVLRVAQWPLRACLRPLTLHVPRDQSLLAFGAASNRFAGNSAYLYLHMSERDDVRCVWVSGSRAVVAALRQRDLAAVYRWSIPGMWVATRAAWYVFSSYRSDVNLWLGDGARTFNLWHGVGVKRIQHDRVVGAGATVYAAAEGSLTARVFADDRHQPDFVLSTSEGMGHVLSRAFDIPRDRCPPLGYPCNDHLAAGMAPPAALVDGELYRQLGDRPVIGYFPTYRDDSVTLPGGSSAVVEELAQIADAQGAVLLFKAHSASVVPLQSNGALVVLPRTADLNAYLGACDVLVTDYSSVASDYLLLDRPIVLFCPDLEAYDGNRGFALDPREFLPGIMTRTLDELYAALSDIRSIPRSGNHRRALDFYWDEGARDETCERIAAFVVAQTEPARGAPKPLAVAAPHHSAARL